MALEWREAVERVDVYLRELLSSGLLFLHAELGVDVGLKAELLPPGLLACVAAGLGLLLLAALLWLSVCRCFSKKPGEKVAPEAGKTSKPEEIKKRSRKRGGDKKVQRNGLAVDLEEDVKLVEAQNLSESPDSAGGKSEKGKKNKKKSKAPVKETKSMSERKEPEEGTWETKVSHKEKKQQRKKDKGAGDESESPGGTEPVVEEPQITVTPSVPITISTKTSNNTSTTKTSNPSTSTTKTSNPNTTTKTSNPNTTTSTKASNPNTTTKTSNPSTTTSTKTANPNTTTSTKTSNTSTKTSNPNTTTTSTKTSNPNTTSTKTSNPNNTFTKTSNSNTTTSTKTSHPNNTSTKTSNSNTSAKTSHPNTMTNPNTLSTKTSNPNTIFTKTSNSSTSNTPTTSPNTKTSNSSNNSNNTNTTKTSNMSTKTTTTAKASNNSTTSKTSTKATKTTTNTTPAPKTQQVAPPVEHDPPPPAADVTRTVNPPVSHGWDGMCVNGSGSWDLGVSVPSLGQTWTSVKSEQSVWPQDMEGSWMIVDESHIPVSLHGMSAGVEAQVVPERPWACPVPVDDEWSGPNNVSAELGSDYCAPCEEWGNYEDPAGGAVSPDEPQDSDLEKDKEEPAAPGSGKAKKKKKKKKKVEDAGNAAQVEVEVGVAKDLNSAGNIFTKTAKEQEIVVPPRVPLKPSELEAMPKSTAPPTQKKAEESWESPKQVKKKKARRET
ncbi:protein LYRIC isoform X2 [Silurus meridionalis]|uniref:protein LYRIC isoform X2 n=1 Tax=Silurus meridionalis TaxID=175797 RepID=UPI001EEB744F|nr:protein LYRIC isoform X2 [Silurus meridionalis]